MTDAAPERSREDLELQLHAHDVLASRRLGYDSLMWQVPSLGLTAQAFLLTIALGPNGAIARAAAGALACLVALISMQLMARHRLNELMDSLMLERIEQDLGLLAGTTAIHASSNSRAAELGLAAPRPAQWSSYSIWLTALAIFAAVAFVASVSAFVDMV